MRSYKKLVVNVPAKEKPTVTPESKYWSKFSEKKTEQHFGRVPCITFCNKAPYDMAVCTGSRIEVYNSSQMDLKRTYARFKNLVNTAQYRSDGSVLLAGVDDGSVQLLNVDTRIILRSILNHTSAVHVAKFVGNDTHLLSASDDKTVKLTDIVTEDVLHTWTEHTDRVRCGIQSILSPDVVITGSYDHTVKMFDSRTNGNSIMSINHGAPVTDMVLFPSGSLLATAGDNYIKIWDLVSKGKLIHTIQNHQKTVSSLSIDNSGSRLISAGLDGFLKFYDLLTYKNVHSIHYDSALLSCAISPDNMLLATGSVDGSIHMRKRPNQPQEIPVERKLNTHTRLFGGSYYKGKESDFIVERTKKYKTQLFDRFLKAFQYAQALDSALALRDPHIVVSLLEELINRNGLDQALSNRDDATLEPILSFLIKYITNPNYSSLLCDIAHLTLEIYTPVVGQSVLVDELFVRLKDKLKEELELQVECFKFQGELDLILSSSTLQFNEDLMNDDNDDDMED